MGDHDQAVKQVAHMVKFRKDTYAKGLRTAANMTAAHTKYIVNSIGPT